MNSLSTRYTRTLKSSKMIVILVLVISCFLPVNGKNFSKKATYNQPREFVPGMVSKKMYDQLHAEYQELESVTLNLVREVEALRALPMSFYDREAEKAMEEGSRILSEMTTNCPGRELDASSNETHEFNKTEEQRLNNLLNEANKQNRQLQKEVNNLKEELSIMDKYMYQFKWKVLVKYVVDDHDTQFDKLELRHSQPEFKLNETFLSETHESWKYDYLAERRRQRWEFYLKTPPYCNCQFEHLAKRIEKSEFTVEAFCRSVAILYKSISLDSYMETVKPSHIPAGYLSQYQKVNFVIPLLLAEYPQTKLIKIIFDEVKSSTPPPTINLHNDFDSLFK